MNRVFNLRSQSKPSYPSGQAQVATPSIVLHDPPFLHGFVWQTSFSVEQNAGVRDKLLIVLLKRIKRCYHPTE